jgi:hypothetical protein
MKRKLMEQEINERNGIKPVVYYRIPEVGERFPFVIIAKSDDISKYGCRIKLSVGDKMEFPDIAEQLDLKIDINQYMTGSIRGLLSRFISYDDEFRKKPLLTDAKSKEENEEIVDDDVKNTEEDDIDDASAVFHANKHIDKLIKEAMGNKTDKKTLLEAKRNSKAIIEKIKNSIRGNDKLNLEIFEKFSRELDKDNNDNINIADFVKKMAETFSKKHLVNAAEFVNLAIASGIDINVLKKAYTGKDNYVDIRQKIIKEEESKLLNELNKLNDVYIKLNEKIIESFDDVNKLIITNEEKSHFERLYQIYLELSVIYELRQSMALVSGHINFMRFSQIS